MTVRPSIILKAQMETGGMLVSFALTTVTLVRLQLVKALKLAQTCIQVLCASSTQNKIYT